MSHFHVFMRTPEIVNIRNKTNPERSLENLQQYRLNHTTNVCTMSFISKIHPDQNRMGVPFRKEIYLLHRNPLL